MYKCVWAFSNISSETTGLIEAKFHLEPPLDRGTKVCSNDPGHMTNGALWLNGRVSDSGARGRGFETYRCRAVSLSKTLYSPKVLVNYPETVAPSRHDWKIVDWDVKPQHKQTIWPPCLYMVKTLKKSSLEPKDQWPWNLIRSIKYWSTTKYVQMMTLGWPWSFYGKVRFAPLCVCMGTQNSRFPRNYWSLWFKSWHIKSTKQVH